MSAWVGWMIEKRQFKYSSLGGWLGWERQDMSACVGDEVGEYVTYGYECSKKRQFKYSSLLIRFFK